MKSFNPYLITNDRVSVLEYEGYGDEATALALLAGAEFTHVNKHWFIRRGGKLTSQGGWLTPQRAAIAFCLGYRIELTSKVTP